MFVRFRSSARRLSLSIVQNERRDGKVRQSHIASLGAVSWPPSVVDRDAFWARLHERLARLANRVDRETQNAILEQVHKKLPLPTNNERCTAQLEQAQADAAKADTAADEAKQHRDRAKNRIASIKAGELFASNGAKPPDFLDELLKTMGWTRSDAGHARRLNRIAEILGEEEMLRQFIEILGKRSRRTEKNVSRDLLSKLLANHPAPLPQSQK